MCGLNCEVVSVVNKTRKKMMRKTLLSTWPTTLQNSVFTTGHVKSSSPEDD